MKPYKESILTADENEALLALVAAAAELDALESAMLPRLKGVPMGLATWRMLRSQARRLYRACAEKLDEQTKRRLDRTMECGRITIKPPSACPSAVPVLSVEVGTMAVLMNAAMEHNCCMCVRENKEIRRCPLRKALSQVALPDRLEDGVCPYADIAVEMLLKNNPAVHMP